MGGASETRRASFFFYRMEALLSIETHLPRCVIVVHNGAHLIQAAQSIFLKPFSPFSAKQVILSRDIAQPFKLTATTNCAFEWNVVCNQDKMLLSAYY